MSETICRKKHPHGAVYRMATLPDGREECPWCRVPVGNPVALAVNGLDAIQPERITTLASARGHHPSPEVAEATYQGAYLDWGRA